MKKFLQISVAPITVGIIAGLLFVTDHFVAQLFVGKNGGTFMWVAFVSWTIFFGFKPKDRIKAAIGYPIGFLAALGMIYFGRIFNLDVFGVSIATLIGVILINAAVMYFENLKKFWMDCIPGIFAGIFLTFSGLGVNMSPTNGVGEAFKMLGIIITYGILGLICGYGCLWSFKKFKKEASAESAKTEEPKKD